MNDLLKSGDYSDILKNIVSAIQGVNSENGDTAAIPDTLEERARQRVNNEDILHQSNIEDVMKGAAERIISEKSKLPSHPVDPDWFRIVMDDVKDISNVEMKRIWSKLVAGEILRPKSYSLRAVHLLRSLSKDDAAIIIKIAPYTLCDEEGKRVILHSHDSDNKIISFDDLLFLGELGLLETSSMISMNWNYEKETTDYSNCVSLYNGEVGVNIFTNSKEYNLPVYTATVIGNQIFSLIEGVTPNTDYYKAILTKLIDNGKCICGHIKESHETGFIFTDEIFRIEKIEKK